MAVDVLLPPAVRPIASEAVLVLDGRLTIRSLNRSAETLLRLHPSDAVGQRVPPALNTQGLRMLRAGWAAPPEHVRIDGERLLLTLVALPPDPFPRIVALLEADPEPLSSTEVAALSARQHEVLTALATGMRCRGIATRLQISETTVRHHIRGILRALGVHSQLAAVAEARAQGLI